MSIPPSIRRADTFLFILEAICGALSGVAGDFVKAKVEAGGKLARTKSSIFWQISFSDPKKAIILLRITSQQRLVKFCMNVKAAKSGGKGSSSKLWVMVQRVTEDQWRQLKAFSEVYGKRSMQFKLIELMRFMKVYDVKAEKEAFSDTDLYSLRRRAKAWLIRTGRRLAFAATEVAEQLGDVEMLVAWGHLEDAWEFVGIGKATATAQEEFVILAGLLEQERLIAKEIFQGEERTAELQRIVGESKANLANLHWALTMEEYQARYMEPVRNKLSVGLGLDREAVEAYFQSEAYLVQTDGLPISIQLEKLLMDEFFLSMRGSIDEAIRIANTTVSILIDNPSMMERFPDRLPKTTMNLVAFYSNLELYDKMKEVVIRFEASKPWAEGNHESSLPIYFFILFLTVIDTSDRELAARGLAAWKDHGSVVLEQKDSRLRANTFLLIALYLLSIGDRFGAKNLFSYISESALVSSNVVNQSMQMLLHLIILFEDGDDRGLESFDRKYRRIMRPTGQLTEPLLRVMTFLIKNVRYMKDGQILDVKEGKAVFGGLITDLQNYAQDIAFQRLLWFDPLIRWAEFWANS